jgi:hypothetical protein
MRCSDCAKYRTKECNPNPNWEEPDLAEYYTCFILKNQKTSWAWWLLPIFFTWLGGIITLTSLWNRNRGKAWGTFWLGMVLASFLLTASLASSGTFSSQPPVRKASGSLVNLVNNEEAVDPTWPELITFLQVDDTDQYRYYDEVMICGDFAEKLHNNAESYGIKAAFVAVWFENEEVGHALNAFNTTDLGLIYIDCTGESFETYSDFISVPKEYEGSCDRVAFIEVDKEYGVMALEKVKAPSYSDYEEYKQSVDDLKREIETFITQSENHEIQVNAFNQQTLFNQSTYNYLAAEARELKKKQKELEETYYELSPIWQSLGIVEEIKIFW